MPSVLAVRLVAYFRGAASRLDIHMKVLSSTLAPLMALIMMFGFESHFGE
jgi:hypothetical protein